MGMESCKKEWINAMMEIRTITTLVSTLAKMQPAETASLGRSAATRNATTEMKTRTTTALITAPSLAVVIILFTTKVQGHRSAMMETIATKMDV